MSREGFRQWIKNELSVKEITKQRYLNTIDVLSNEAIDWGLGNIDIYLINESNEIDEILENPKFISKNLRGNRMYSSALNHYKSYLLSKLTKESDVVMNGNELEDVVLIKINKSYKKDFTDEELYQATSASWVASFGKTETRDLKYYCAVYQNKILEVYDFLGFEEEKPKREPSRYILEGKITEENLRSKLIGLDVSSIHGGRGNPIKYTRLELLLNLTGKLVEPKLSIEGKELVAHIHSYITSKGFNYSIEHVKNLYLSLRSKPFVIISGISGTGKTKIVQLFAESLGATEENGQFSLIPVRPDWSDGSELLGYRDIKGDFVKGPFVKMVERAIENPEQPYFILLDEMNLARVEYYFSDLLSVMESRRREGDRIVSSYLLEEKVDGQHLSLPENLIMIGTVNMDETTHPFSKKVLDRANTIEFNEINLENFAHLEVTEEVPMEKVLHEKIAAIYISLKDVYEKYEQLIVGTSKKLAQINQYLGPLNAQVGYRVRDEICFYMIHNEEAQLLEEDEAFDFCLMQKILPRIAGGDDRIDVLLSSLFKWLTNREYEKGVEIIPSRYPRSAKKVAEMLRGYQEDGFTSYWIT